MLTNESILVRPCREVDVAVWEEYVSDCPAATVFHRLIWSRSVAEVYSHQPHHLAAWAGERMVGILPLFLVKSLFVGRALVSIPYATYGGIVADDDNAAKALLSAVEELADQLSVRYLDLRHCDANSLGLAVIDRYDTFRRELPEQPEEVLANLPRKTRAAARKGLDALGPEAVAVGPQWLDPIYDLYARTMRRLGSPNYRRELFRSLQAAYSDDCVCLVVRDGGQPVAGVVSFVFRDEIVPYFSGSLEEGMARQANNVMYLKLMEYAVERGLKRFDFNRTRRDNRGPHAFKRYHGFEPAPLHYQIRMANGSEAANLTPSNRKFAMAERIWRHLPMWLTRAAGSTVTKWIP